jgi:hypothetical protein
MRSPSANKKNAKLIIEFVGNSTGSNEEKVRKSVDYTNTLALWNDDVQSLLNMACTIAKENTADSATYQILQSALAEVSKSK